MTTQRQIVSSTNGTTLADLLERILDKGIVIAGDIKVKIADIELLDDPDSLGRLLGGQGQGDRHRLVGK